MFPLGSITAECVFLVAHHGPDKNSFGIENPLFLASEQSHKYFSALIVCPRVFSSK
jgi:hypothetical protein